MVKRLAKLVTASGMAAALSVAAVPKPAAADTQSTINTLLGAAAVVGGIILYNNYEHKRQAANTIVGYTRNGGTVYGDGRIVMPNGQTIYPNGNGAYPWGQTAYYAPGAAGYSYDYNRTGRWDRTHRHWSTAYARSAYRPAYVHNTYVHNTYVQHDTYRPAVYRPAYVHHAHMHPAPGHARWMEAQPRFAVPHDNGRHAGWAHQEARGGPPHEHARQDHGPGHERGPGHEH